LSENGISVPVGLEEKAERWSRSAKKTVIWFSDSRKGLALLAISDKIKPCRRMLLPVEALGVELYMLTGDNLNTAGAVAKQAGIGHFQAEMLPHEKSEFVKQLQQQGKVVAMVGDGNQRQYSPSTG
jgi:Cu2+-exporting ATPase